MPPTSLPSVCTVTGCSVCDSDPGSKCERCDEGRRLNGDNSACITGGDDGNDGDGLSPGTGEHAAMYKCYLSFQSYRGNPCRTLTCGKVHFFSVGLTCSQDALSSREIALITATVFLSVLVVGLAVIVVILGLRLSKRKGGLESQEYTVSVMVLHFIMCDKFGGVDDGIMPQCHYMEKIAKK